jgi:hypothetical protein
MRMWATGTITLSMVLEAKGVGNSKAAKSIDAPAKTPKGLTLPKNIISTGGNHVSTAFCDATWGKASWRYMHYINNQNNFRTSSFEKTIEKAKEFAAASQGGGSRPSTVIDIDELERPLQVLFVDISDSENECMPLLLAVRCDLPVDSFVRDVSSAATPPLPSHSLATGPRPVPCFLVSSAHRFGFATPTPSIFVTPPSPILPSPSLSLCSPQ